MVDVLVGKVHQLNIGQGGIPKIPVQQLRATRLGAVGDNHTDRLHHGGERRALCLYALEAYNELGSNPNVRVLEPTLQPNTRFKDRAGESPRPGDFGENITTVGIDYSKINIGDIFRAGSVELEITMPRVPCMTVGEVFGHAWLGLVYDAQVDREALLHGRNLRYGEAPMSRSTRWGKSGFKAMVKVAGLIRTGDPISRVDDTLMA